MQVHHAILGSGTTSHETGETRAQDTLAYGLQVSGSGYWQHGTELRTPAAIMAMISSVEKVIPNLTRQWQRIRIRLLP